MFSTKVTVRFYNCDPAGIIFFSNIFLLAENAFENMIREFDLIDEYFNNSKITAPLLSCSAEYKAMLKFGDIVDVEINLSQIKTSSYELCYEFKKEKKVYAIVKTAHIFLNKESKSKIEIPDYFKKVISKLDSKI